MKQHHHRNEAEEHDALVLLLETGEVRNTVQSMDVLFSERWLFLAGLSFPQVGRLTEHVESSMDHASAKCLFSVKELGCTRDVMSPPCVLTPRRSPLPPWVADGCEVPGGVGQKGLMANVIIPHDTCRAGGSLSRHSNGRGIASVGWSCGQ